MFFITCFEVATSQDLFVVELRDKGALDTTNPKKYLSERSLQRRLNQGIKITESDLPVCPKYLDDISRIASIKMQSKWLNHLIVSTNDPAEISKLQYVKFIKPLKRSGTFFHCETLNQQKAKELPMIYSSSRQLEMLELDILHANGYTGKGRMITFFDNGFTKIDRVSAYGKVFNKQKIVAMKNFVNPDLNPFNTESDGEHGSRVFSIVSGLIPPIFIGAAFDADFALAVTEDNSKEGEIEEYNWLAAAEWADSLGTDIISSSLGYANKFSYGEDHKYDDMDGKTTIVSRAANMAAAKGILVVNSAGNEGNSSWKYVIAPADADSCLAVGGVDAQENRVSFSSQGPTFDGRLKPDVVALANRTIQVGSDGRIIYGFGTSFSAPLIAGLSACLWQADISLRNMDLFRIIKASGNNANSPDSLIGWGIPRGTKALKLINGQIVLQPLANSNYIKILPNPIADKFKIVYQNYLEQEEFEISFIELSGEEKKKLTVLINVGYNEIDVNATDLNLKNGLYIALFKNQYGAIIEKQKIMFYK